MPENYILLERTELNASAASVTFANIPQSGYTDLKVVMSTRTTETTANASTPVALQFNGDTASNYVRRSLTGNGASATSNSATTTSMRIGFTSTNGCAVNTFGNGEFYIPNYTGSTQKSVSSDAVAEDNATTPIFSSLMAGLWTGTTAITSITIITPSYSFLAGSTFSLYGIAAVGTTPVIAPKASGGNVIDFDGTNWIHTFLTSGTFIPQTGLTCDYLVVAGGGGGSTNEAGGGGAGGLRSTVTATGGGGSLESAISVASNTAYAITIGAGGAASGTNGFQGSSSIFSTITSTGGGGGGNGGVAGTTGGSGGGSGAFATTGGSRTASPIQGFNGGGGSPANGGGGGGGGASAVGVAGISTKGGNGGNGQAISITGTSVTYSGGGGGGAATGSTIGTGGTGGGGNGGASGVVGSIGTVNTGGGGGGGGAGGGTTGGNGGSGIVIIRYPAA